MTDGHRGAASALTGQAGLQQLADQLLGDCCQRLATPAALAAGTAPQRVAARHVDDLQGQADGRFAIDVASGDTLWSGTGGKSGWSREALAAVAQQLIRDLLQAGLAGRR